MMPSSFVSSAIKKLAVVSPDGKETAKAMDDPGDSLKLDDLEIKLV